MEGQGEVDEGFDEEFEGELQGPEGEPSLDMQEIQHLLLQDGLDSVEFGLPGSVPLDDFDLGVDVLDSEHSTHMLIDSEPLKSPLNHIPTSPYQVPVASPAIPTADLQSMCLSGYESYNNFLNQGMDPDALSEYGSLASSSQSCYSSAHSYGSYGQQSDELEILHSVCSNMGASVPSLTDSCSSPIPSPHTRYSPVSRQNAFASVFWAGSQPIDLSETPELVSASCSASFQSPRTLADNRTLQIVNCGRVDEGTSMGLRVKREKDSATYSKSSQTFSSSSSSSSSQTYSVSPSPSPSPATPLGNGDASTSREELVSMPFYRFKKLLESPVVSEQEKAEAKNARRRGKNKVAAKNCRQRKLEIISGLMQEVEMLKSTKTKLAVKTQTLEEEIETLKRRCALAERNIHKS